MALVESMLSPSATITSFAPAFQAESIARAIDSASFHAGMTTDNVTTILAVAIRRPHRRSDRPDHSNGTHWRRPLSHRRALVARRRPSACELRAWLRTF